MDLAIQSTERSTKYKRKRQNKTDAMRYGWPSKAPPPLAHSSSSCLRTRPLFLTLPRDPSLPTFLNHLRQSLTVLPYPLESVDYTLPIPVAHLLGQLESTFDTGDLDFEAA